MTDKDFLSALLTLNAKGADGLVEMRQVLKENGGMKRLLAIAIGKQRKPRAERSAAPDGFDAFYAAFPRREAKGDAEKAYAAALSRSTPEIILAGAKRYAEAMKQSEFRFIKYPATWLRADCWKDELGALRLVGAPEETGIDVWLRRLSIFYYGDEESGLEVGYWSNKWGAKHGRPGCQVPAEAATMFEAKKQARLL